MKNKNVIQRGQAITFRLPSDTPDHILKQLQKIKEREKRNFSSTIAQFALEGVKNTLVKERESITIPLPKQLSPEQRSWLRHSHSETLIGTIVYQLLEDPVKATALYASLNNNFGNFENNLFLQEKMNDEQRVKNENLNDDLENFDVSKFQERLTSTVENEKIEEVDGTELLGDFIAQMNK